MFSFLNGSLKTLGVGLVYFVVVAIVLSGALPPEWLENGPRQSTVADTQSTEAVPLKAEEQELLRAVEQTVEPSRGPQRGLAIDSAKEFSRLVDGLLLEAHELRKELLETVEKRLPNRSAIEALGNVPPPLGAVESTPEESSSSVEKETSEGSRSVVSPSVDNERPSAYNVCSIHKKQRRGLLRRLFSRLRCCSCLSR
jgi:hypothetical protein